MRTLTEERRLVVTVVCTIANNLHYLQDLVHLQDLQEQVPVSPTITTPVKPDGKVWQ